MSNTFWVSYGAVWFFLFVLIVLVLHENLGDIPPAEYELQRILDEHVTLEGLKV